MRGIHLQYDNPMLQDNLSWAPSFVHTSIYHTLIWLFLLWLAFRKRSWETGFGPFSIPGSLFRRWWHGGGTSFNAFDTKDQDATIRSRFSQWSSHSLSEVQQVRTQLDGFRAVLAWPLTPSRNTRIYTDRLVIKLSFSISNFPCSVEQNWLDANVFKLHLTR